MFVGVYLLMPLQVHQPDERVAGSQEYIDIGVTVLKVLPDGSRNVVASTGIEVDRQSQLQVCHCLHFQYSLHFLEGPKLSRTWK